MTRPVALSILALAAIGCATTALAPPLAQPNPARASETTTSTPASTPPTTAVAATTAPTTTVQTTTTTTTTATEPPSPRRAIVNPCPGGSATPEPIAGDVVSASTAAARALVCSSTDAVVVAPDDEIESGVRTASLLQAPLLYATPDTPFQPDDLGIARVWTSDERLVAGGKHAVLPLPGHQGEISPMARTATDGEVDQDDIQTTLEECEPADSLVVVSSQEPALGPVAAATAEAIGGVAVWTDPGDLRRRPRLAPFATGARQRWLLGSFDPEATWQMEVLAGGSELPGGGRLLFPDKRLVALYGHPHTGSLGVLGEQPVDEAIQRAHELAAAYATEGTDVLPTFEISVTTATAGPGADGDYSSELTVDEVRPWVEAAGEAGIYVVLDLQPGRTDFLTQAKIYEEFLRLPHVGLALDPEWRLGPDQRHLRQIGSVDAAEINTVVDWLAGIVRAEQLPQKLLLLHQFKLSMITDRNEVRTPPELAVVIQMDGQGPIATKYDTWNALLAAGEGGWSWGWKNFYDEDRPTPTPEQVLDLDPVPVFVSYQ